MSRYVLSSFTFCHYFVTLCACVSCFSTLPLRILTHINSTCIFVFNICATVAFIFFDICHLINVALHTLHFIHFCTSLYLRIAVHQFILFYAHCHTSCTFCCLFFFVFLACTHLSYIFLHLVLSHVFYFCVFALVLFCHTSYTFNISILYSYCFI